MPGTILLNSVAKLSEPWRSSFNSSRSITLTWRVGRIKSLLVRWVVTSIGTSSCSEAGGVLQSRARKRIRPGHPRKHPERMIMLPRYRQPEKVRTAAKKGKVLAVSGLDVGHIGEVIAAIGADKTTALEDNPEAGPVRRDE